MATATKQKQQTLDTKQQSEPTSLLDETITATEQHRKTLTESAAALLGVAPGKLFGMLRNVWKTSKGQPELTDEEMFVGISMIARYQLDPIAREIYVTRDKTGRLLTIIGVDGWIKILDRTPGYDGFEVDMQFDEKTKHIEWVETRIYHKERSKPSVYRAFWSEYKHVAGFVANNGLPIHMLRVFSLHHATRLFTPIGAYVVTPEEAEYMGRMPEPGSTPRKKVDSLDSLMAAESTQDKPAAPQEPLANSWQDEFKIALDVTQSRDDAEKVVIQWDAQQKNDADLKWMYGLLNEKWPKTQSKGQKNLIK